LAGSEVGLDAPGGRCRIKAAPSKVESTGTNALGCCAVTVSVLSGESIICVSWLNWDWLPLVRIR
jgi:hypothetical protein